MFTHPQRETELSASKLRGLYEDDEEALRGIPNRQAGETLPHAGFFAHVADYYYYFAVLALAGFGFLAWLRRPRSALLLPLLVIGVFTLGQLIFFTDPRFHYPMLAAAGAVAAVEAAGGFFSRRYRARNSPPVGW